MCYIKIILIAAEPLGFKVCSFALGNVLRAQALDPAFGDCLGMWCNTLSQPQGAL